MKRTKRIVIVLLTVFMIAAAVPGRADDQKPKPSPLGTCPVCGMKLGSMGNPHVFIYKGQEIKVCDYSEKPEFYKAPEKYLKKLADAGAKLKK